MSFRGWPAEALEFYDGLEADNSKAYWTEHKAVYEETVLGPMRELLEELAPDFGDPKIFRPYRDVRFSRDKSPYKTHIGAVLGDGYIQLSSNGLAAGSGMYGMAPDQLERIFDRFARLDEGRSRDNGGVGLGLPIARAIAEAHGGSIRVHSALGKGSVFEIVLPRLMRGAV